MSLFSVFFSSEHWKSPFTVKVDGTTLSIEDEKVKIIALSVFAGILTLGVGGVFVFYGMTAWYKVEELSRFQICVEQEQLSRVIDSFKEKPLAESLKGFDTEYLRTQKSL